jgi:hypothetical protein
MQLTTAFSREKLTARQISHFYLGERLNRINQLVKRLETSNETGALASGPPIKIER